MGMEIRYVNSMVARDSAIVGTIYALMIVVTGMEREKEYPKSPRKRMLVIQRQY